MVETLKQSGHEVTLILKTPKPLEGTKYEKDDQTDEGVVADGSSGSCELLDPVSNQITESDGLSVDDVDMEGGSGINSPDGFQGDTDLSSLQNVLRAKKQASLDLKRTSSAPLTDKEKAEATSEVPSNSSKDTLEETDGGPTLSPPPIGGFEQRLHTRAASTGTKVWLNSGLGKGSLCLVKGHQWYKSLFVCRLWTQQFSKHLWIKDCVRELLLHFTVGWPTKLR